MCALIYVLLCVTACGAVRGPLARPAAGPVRGLARDFTMFLGVPYGKIQEDNYFSEALPYPAFTEEFQATENPVICPQHNRRGFEGEIHCLNLNIYTPNNITTNSKLPVMVYIHGGGFTEGDGNLNSLPPTFLINKDVIVVTINYRLGIYGFLCLPQVGISNQGLKDQQLALKWIKSNIAAFGGDDSNITLFGHSAGSISVDIHLLYGPNDLFSKVILQSGQIISPIVNQVVSDEEFLRGTDSFRNLSDYDWMNHLTQMNVSELITLTKEHAFRPCIDGNFITKYAKNYALKDKSVLIGNANKEMLFFYKDTNDYISKYDQLLKMAFTGIESTDIESFKTFYSTGNTKDDAVRFGTDIAFSYPLERSVRYYLDNRATVFRYLFSYDGERNYVKIRDNIIGEGATHGDELGYLFQLPLFFKPPSENDMRVIEYITTVWTNFAKYGDPTPTMKQESSLPSWPKYDKINNYIMTIGSNASVVKYPWLKSVAFWDEFYKNHEGHTIGIRLNNYSMNNARNNVLSYSLIVLVTINVLF
ncbi:carboxylesterase 1D-like [Anticarsia gemmatalis]|uniref:carboxylesterase 1D-like n=1 Tax=Anticarsia gemmatalis TaxID=129554 RepID=UPI003F7774D2